MCNYYYFDFIGRYIDSNSTNPLVNTSSETSYSNAEEHVLKLPHLPSPNRSLASTLLTSENVYNLNYQHKLSSSEEEQDSSESEVEALETRRRHFTREIQEILARNSKEGTFSHIPLCHIV